MKIGNEIKAILFDLDGTLLEVDLIEFIIAYNKHLHTYIPNSMTLSKFARLNWNSIKMIENNISDKTNLDIFLENFLPSLGLARKKGIDILKNYYNNEYHELKKYVKARPKSREIVQCCIKKNYNITIATTPVFIRDAIIARLKWAGIDDLSFNLITSAETFTRCKPNLEYYKEIFQKIGKKPEECLMVGDEHNDMIAKSLGCSTFLIKSSMTRLKDNTPEPDFVGDLNYLIELL